MNGNNNINVLYIRECANKSRITIDIIDNNNHNTLHTHIHTDAYLIRCRFYGFVKWINYITFFCC
jgi:hypothetical protein